MATRRLRPAGVPRLALLAAALVAATATTHQAGGADSAGAGAGSAGEPVAFAAPSAPRHPFDGIGLSLGREMGTPAGEPCSAPAPLATDAPNILTIGDSISMCGYGYGHFVHDMLVTQTAGRLAGYSSACGQMASTANSTKKMASCIGNATGTLKGKPFSVITYNAGLHDCDTSDRVHADAYRINLKAGLQVLKGAAHAVAVTTTTPFDIDVKKPNINDGGINMSCVMEYNVIAKEVAAEVGASVVDLYGYVEEFCQQGPLLPASSGFGGNYTACAVQSSGLHFFTSEPQPSGQQYTGLHIAAEATKMIPNAHIANKTEGEARILESSSMPDTMSCGNPPAPLSTTLPNVLIIGDSISEPGSGYGPGVEQLLMRPGVPWRNGSGPLAAVQHNGNTGSNQAGPTTNGVNCIKSWVGKDYKWDVITMNFGIHDCCPPKANVAQTWYVKNLGVIYEAARAALAPGGKILWVSTTPVPTADGAAPQPFTCGRSGPDFNTCIDDYNAAALTLLGSKPDVKVLDLNGAVSAVCGKPYEACNLQLWHNVHFTTAGKQFCAVQVSHAIGPMLAPRWHTLCTACAEGDNTCTDNNMRCECKAQWKACRFPWKAVQCKAGLPPVSPPAGGGNCSALSGTGFRCGGTKSCDLLSVPCPDYAACCEMCTKHSGCGYWTHTMHLGKPTCFLKANFSDIVAVYDMCDGCVSGSTPRTVRC